MEDVKESIHIGHWKKFNAKNILLVPIKETPRDDFIVKLPLKGNIESLGKSYNVATKCLRTLEEKLDKQPDLKQHYHEFLHEYLELGHMTELQESTFNNCVSYYIPHHAIIKEDSTTIKVRVVFDASYKTSAKNSLNFLMVGPNVQKDIYDIILRLRQHRYAMSTDIKKMYRQIDVA